MSTAGQGPPGTPVHILIASMATPEEVARELQREATPPGQQPRLRLQTIAQRTPAVAP